MGSDKKILIYKISISLTFGILGFISNFHTIIFKFGDYTVAVLFGLLFPLLITLSWGWKYGLLSALAGGCQSMWWLWGPSNGYAVFLIVPPFTLWIVWHGYFSEKRKRLRDHSLRYNPYLLEIPFRILNSISLFTIVQWAVSKNPPPWSWAVNSNNIVSMEFSEFIIIKQASVALVLLLICDVLLNINIVRAFFKLEPLVDQKRTGYVVSISLLLGGLYWILDSVFYAFAISDNRSFVDYFVRDIPDSNLFTRVIFLIFCLTFGMAMSRMLRKQKEDEIALERVREESLSKEVFLRTLFQTIPDLVWIKDPHGKYLLCNPRYEQFIGSKESDIIGKTDEYFYGAKLAEVIYHHDRKVIDEGKVYIYETDFTFKIDGHKERVEIIKAPMYDDSQKLIAVIGLGRNITERVSLQNQLVDSQKMESIGRLAGGVAHDFNNMLSVILGISEIIVYKFTKDDSLIEYISEIQNAAERSVKLTKQLLAFARKQTIDLESINMNDAIEDILKMIRRLIRENIELDWQPGDDLWKTKGDHAQIDQVLTNLCVNANDAIVGFGKITIGTKNITVGSEFYREDKGIKSGDYVQVTLSDTGNGMDSETQEHIFEPFYTTKETGKGTGLGLATVYGIMKQHGGVVSVHSELGKGCDFKLFFPRDTKENNNKEILKKYRPHLTGRETILIVEDEKSILKVMEEQLESLGYKVMVFTSGREAIEHSRLVDKIDLLITDVVMPKVNGKEVSSSIAKYHPDIKTLFISGYPADVIAQQGILDEGLFFLNKPFSQNTLAEKLRDILEYE